jgi:hypothetical protein
MTSATLPPFLFHPSKVPKDYKGVHRIKPRKQTSHTEIAKEQIFRTRILAGITNVFNPLEPYIPQVCLLGTPLAICRAGSLPR